MCERLEILGHLRELAARGVPLVNAPDAVLNTYRDRMIALLEEAGVAFVESRLVGTADADVTPAGLPVWVKRGDVHNTQEGDVTFAASADAVRRRWPAWPPAASRRRCCSRTWRATS